MLLNPYDPLIRTQIGNSGTIAALDYGKKNIGLAVSDSEQILSIKTTLYTFSSQIKSKTQFIHYLAQFIQENYVILLVLGLPLSVDGSPNTSCQSVKDFQHYLAQFFIDLNMLFWDERYTSVASEKTLKQMQIKRKNCVNSIDRVSAALILQSFLDFLNYQ